MSKRRRRNSRRRKSSSSSKQSICPYSLHKNTKTPRDDGSLMDEHTEKGEADSLHKENSLSKSDAEDDEKEKETETPCEENRRDSTVACFQGNCDSQASSPTDDPRTQSQRSDQGLRITTSVTIENLEKNTSQIVLQRSHESGTGLAGLGSNNNTIAVTTTKLKGIQANMKIEISEVLRVDDSDYKTTFILQRAPTDSTSAAGPTSETPNNERFSFSHPCIQMTRLDDDNDGTQRPFENVSYEFSVVEMSREGLVDMRTDSVPPVCYSEDCYKSCCQDRCYGYGHFRRYDTDCTLVDESSTFSTPSDFCRLQKDNSITSDTQVDIPPPVEFADPGVHHDNVNDLTQDVRMFHIGAPDEANYLEESASAMTYGASSRARESLCCPSTEGGRSYDDEDDDDADDGSDCMEADDLSMWPDAPMSRSSFTKSFIHKHKRKTCIRNNSIAILENNTPPAGYLNIPLKRRKTLPALLNQSDDNHEDMVPMCRESFSSGALSPFFTQSLARETERAERFYLDEDPSFSPLFPESRKNSKSSTALATSPARRHSMFSPKFYACSSAGTSLFDSDRDTASSERALQLELSAVEEANSLDGATGSQVYERVTESGFDEEMGDMESVADGGGMSMARTVSFRDHFIHITPPSPGSSRESDINCDSSSHKEGQRKMSEVDKAMPQQHTREADVSSQAEAARQGSTGSDGQPKTRKGSVTTVMRVGSEQRILHSHCPDPSPSEKINKEVTPTSTTTTINNNNVNSHNDNDDINSTTTTTTIINNNNNINSTTVSTPKACCSLFPIVDVEQMEENIVAVETGQLSPALRPTLVSQSSISIQSLSPLPCEATELHSDSNHSLRSSQEAEVKDQGALEKRGKCKTKRSLRVPHKAKALAPGSPRRHSTTKISDIKQMLSHKDPDEAGPHDHWARRRKLFKESKHRSSAGGSSIASNITDESDTMFSEDVREVETTVRHVEDRLFYTETFHCAAWLYRGDDVSPAESPRVLSKRPRPVNIRERTVKITKGFGEYPWGFRIQFSKPIIVTEVDTNGAAEEAGLLVGDYVLVVNGTDVTNAPHSEAADLARQGPDLLTLIIGSDIGRCPNTPRPACRGYLHKRTQSSLIKGWRKRWFVLRHDCCLYYYRYKKDEGKSQPLSKLKMEGAEVEADSSLGKPFVFKCSPANGGRVYYFCATSNQDMKRWVEAMSEAVQPLPPDHVWVDVTRHNASLPPLAVKAPECLGLLHQLDRTKDVWVQNYCILKDGCLYLYSSIRSTFALGGVYLQGYNVREQPMGSKRSTIELKPPSEEFKTLHFCADNPTENKRWILAIRASISKWVPLHQAIQDYMSKPPEETRM
ncbi:uncharacterized protein pdzph1 [Engraulis encrasicolus]|uniref:uncharacterized protein pdzph1 n=1 Tax=Engraulis encrasicolus TaxID=184585 RepID=UPI002FD4A3F4